MTIGPILTRSNRTNSDVMDLIVSALLAKKLYDNNACESVKSSLPPAIIKIRISSVLNI